MSEELKEKLELIAGIALVILLLVVIAGMAVLIWLSVIKAAKMVL